MIQEVFCGPHVQIFRSSYLQSETKGTNFSTKHENLFPVGAVKGLIKNLDISLPNAFQQPAAGEVSGACSFFSTVRSCKKLLRSTVSGCRIITRSDLKIWLIRKTCAILSHNSCFQYENRCVSAHLGWKILRSRSFSSNKASSEI